MASGWNLWVWLQYIGVVMGVVVRRYIDILTIIINFPYSTCISSFFGSSIPTSLFIKKIVSFLIIIDHCCVLTYTLWPTDSPPYLVFSSWYTVSRVNLDGTGYEELVGGSIGKQAVDYHWRLVNNNNYNI